MIAKNVPNTKKSSTKAGRVAGLAEYITEPELSNEREKCISSEAVNFLSNDLQSQTAEMVALAQEAVKSKDPIDHWVLSWKEHERPTPEQAREAAAIFIKHCGLEGHQYITGLHDDTENMHLHIAVNRVHPDTCKVVKINQGFDKEAAQQSIAVIEKVQGWSPEKNARYRTNDKAELVIDQTTKRPQIFKAADKPLEPTGPAKDMEIQTGEKSAQRIGIEQAAPIIAQATSWKELHTSMAAAGLEYRREGSGAKVYVGDVGVKASDVDRKASFSAMQKRLGPYQPPTEIKPNEYHHHASHTTRSPSGAIVATQKPHSPALGKEPGHGLRNLSKCTLAVLTDQGKTRRAGVLHLDGRAGGRPADGLRREAGRDAQRTGLTPQPMKDGQPGWHEYIAIRDAQKAAKGHAKTDQQKRHGDERETLAAKQKAERDEIFKGNWKGKGEAKNLLKSVTATQQAAEKLELSQQHKEERKALQASYKPLPMYKQWKEQPQIVGMKVLPLIDQHATRDKQVTVAQTLRSLSHSVDARKHITYQLDSKNVFRDEGKTIAILDTNSNRGIAAALATAQQKFGPTLELTGSEAFKRKAVAVAVENGLTCKFSDPALDKLREQLQAEKYQAARDASRAERERAAEKQLEKSKEADQEKEAAKAKEAQKTTLQPIQNNPAQPVPLAPGHQTPEPQQPINSLDVKGLATDREREWAKRVDAAIKANNGPALEKCMDELGGIRKEALTALAAVSPQEVNKAAIAHQVKQEQNAASKKQGYPQPWGFEGKATNCSWDRHAKEAAEERDAHAKTERPKGMFKGAEGKAWDEQAEQLAKQATNWEKAADGVKRELSLTTEKRVSKEAEAVAASNTQNAPQHARQQGRAAAIADIQKRLEKAFAPHYEKQQERDHSRGR